MSQSVAYINEVVYQWCFEEPIQLNLIVFKYVLQHHVS